MLLGVLAFIVFIVVGLSWAFSDDQSPPTFNRPRGAEPGSLAIPRRVTIVPPSTPGVMILQRATRLDDAVYVVRIVQTGGTPVWFEPAPSDAALAYVVD